VSRHPDSQYALDANKRMLFLKNRLSTHEVQVAQYYMERSAYVAAANRGRFVIENYQESIATPRALEIMYQAYTQLGLDDLAADSKLVLNKNFPNYSVSNYETKVDSLLSTATFGLFGSTSKQPPLWSPATAVEQAPEEIIEDKDPSQKRSWFDTMTFGLFD